MGFLKIWLERWFNMVIAVSSTAKPNFKQGFQVNGSDYTATELNTALGGGDPGTAGTVTASKSVIVDSNKDIAIFRNLSAVNLDAGASGTVGTVDIFPTTASKGKIQIAAADSAGNTTTTITNASQAAARTYTIPDAGANASFVMTAGAQTIAGSKTFTSALFGQATIGATRNNGVLAGSLYAESITAGKGFVSLSTSDNTGDTNTNINAAAQSGDRTLTIPDDFASAAAFTLVKQVTDAGPMTATGGAFGSLAYNTSDSKVYFCTVAHATAATWVALN